MTKHRYKSGSMTYEVLLERRGTRYRANINGEDYDVEVLDAQPGVFSLRFAAAHQSSDAAPAARSSAETGDDLVDGPPAPFAPQVVYWAADGDGKEPLWLSIHGCTYRLERANQRRARNASGAAPEDTLRAPMPAQVRGVQVVEGDTVAAGQTLLLLEAMKMEIRLQAPRPGRVARLLAKAGETVDRDQVLVELAPDTSGDQAGDDGHKLQEIGR